MVAKVCETERKPSGKPLNREDLKIAARLYYKERWDWGRVAKELQTTPQTLYNHRYGLTGPPGEWAEVVAEIVEEMKAEAPGTAWGGLIRAARSGDTSASKELLARTEGAVAQKHLLGQDPEADPLRFVLERFSPGQIAEELGNGRFGGGSAGDAGGGVGRDAAPGGGEAPAGEGEV